MSAALRSVLATNSLAPTYNRSLDTTYVLVGLLVRVLEVHVTHVYNDQMDSVFSDPEIRQFGKKKLERLKRP